LPYRKAAALLQELLPASNAKLSHTSVRRQTLSVGALLDQRVTEPEEYDCLEPCRQAVRAGNRLTIAIDGTYVRSDLTNGLYQHYVVAGRVERDRDLGGHFAWVAQRPDDALQFMKAAMRGDGWTERSRVAVLADGADGLADLVSAVSPNTCRSILDWFHIRAEGKRRPQASRALPNMSDSTARMCSGARSIGVSACPLANIGIASVRTQSPLKHLTEFGYMF